MQVKNRERRDANISLIVLLIGGAMIGIPFLFEDSFMNWGYASMFVGAIVALTAFFTFLMMNGRAKVYKRILEEKNILAHWIYDPKFWRDYIAEDLAFTKTARWIAYGLGIIFVLIGFVVYVADPDENLMFFVIMFVVAVIIFIGANIGINVQKNRLTKGVGEAIIVKEGVYFKGTLYTWNQKAISYLEGVGINPTNAKELLIIFRHLGGRSARYIRNVIGIPIPLGEEERANRIVNFFNMPLPPDAFDEEDQDASDEEE